MGKRYNIIDRITNAKERSTIQVDETHEFKINDSFPAAMAIRVYMEDKKLDEEKKIEKVLGVAFKKEDVEYIKGLGLKLTGYTAIINTIMAAISDMDLEEIEKVSEEKKDPSK